ncbi:unnamed protein product [Meganyctiphanes norvegica]|uniref:Uncharacterized protein n=1 Tax=Meganyctiphanes norvegica TaxID=48144 RepID=A0AAV2QSC9_MEGNR
MRCSTMKVEKQAAKSRRPTLVSVSSEPSAPITPSSPNLTLERKFSTKSLVKKFSDHSIKRRKSSTNKSNTRDQRVARTVFVVFLMIVVCSIPVGAEHSLNKTCVKNPTKFLMMHILYWMQYWLNLFVYVLMNQQYRNAYVEYLSKFIPNIGIQKGKTFFWENHSTAANKPTDLRKGSHQSVRKDSGVPEMPGTPRVLISKNSGKCLSAIAENLRSSVLEDDVFEETKQNTDGPLLPDENICMLSKKGIDSER